jgi:ATP-dependent protease ClpP protease subunit
MTHYLLSFNGDVYERQMNALRDRIAQALERPDFEDVTVLFTSLGGSTDQGIAFYNFLKSSPKPIHIHAAGHVESMAVVAFVGAHIRTCSQFSRFFFHAYDYGFAARETLDGIEQARLRLDDDIKTSSAIVAKETKIPSERLHTLYGNAPIPTIIGPDEAKSLGIVNDVTEVNPTGASEVGVALWTVNW